MSSRCRIKQNFYTVSCYKMVRITKADREAMTDDEREYWSRKRYWFIKKQLPDNRLYAGWGSRYATRLTPEDLPESYLRINNYKKNGYIRTDGVVSLVYKPSPFHNHSFKDDFLYISYNKQLGEYREGYDANSTFANCDEYLFGSDIVDFIFAVEKYSPDIDVGDIKRRMVDQYNAYVDEQNEIGRELRLGEPYKKIDRLEDLR